MRHVETGVVFLTLGMYAYVPTLPDPYAANLGVLKAQFERVARFTLLRTTPDKPSGCGLSPRRNGSPLRRTRTRLRSRFISRRWRIQFDTAPRGNDPAAGNGNPSTAGRANRTACRVRCRPSPASVRPALQPGRREHRSAAYRRDCNAEFDGDGGIGAQDPLPTINEWDERFGYLQQDNFALLDVSSNANQMGVSFAWFGDRQMTLVRTHEAVPIEAPDPTTDSFPLQVRGLDIVAKSRFVRAFTTPIVSWEPVINLTEPEALKNDPPTPLNYYPDDGGPTKIFNNSVQLVPVAPIPVCDMLVDAYEKEPGNLTAAYFTLPFGLRSLAYLYKTSPHEAQTCARIQRPLIRQRSHGRNTAQADGRRGFQQQGKQSLPRLYAANEQCTGFERQENRYDHAW